MLDVFGGLFVTGYIGSILAIAFRRAAEVGALKALRIGLVLWAAGESGLFVASRLGATGPLPPNVLMFGLSLLMLTFAWVLAPAFRRAAAGTPQANLLGLHAWRLGGFFFLLLYAQDRLGAPFAPVAAMGDMITGAIAALFAIRLLHGGRVGAVATSLWNAFGLMDLVVAVGLAFLSIPGAPFQLFTDVPAENAFAALPWIFVPAAIVPALFFVHLAIFAKIGGIRGPIGDNHLDGVNA